MVNNIKDTLFYKVLKKRKKTQLLNMVDIAAAKCEETLPLINKVFSNYTLHGIRHSLNIMEYMAVLISDIQKMNDLDIVLCIYASLFHDIGMVVFDDEIEEIKENRNELVTFDFNILMKEFKDEIKSLQECIRPIHGKRVATVLTRSESAFTSLFCIPDTNISFLNDVIKICQAHNEEFDWINLNILKDIKKGEYSINPQFVAILLRIADLLDIDEKRAPQYLYSLLQPTGVGDQEWRQHFVLENKNKIEYNEKLNCKEIQFYGKCEDIEIYRKFLGYIEYLKKELENAVKYSQTLGYDKYILNLTTNPKISIITPGFSFADYKLNLDYNAVTNLLMGENIYGHKTYGLRELLQNSLDACNILKENSQREPNKYETYKPFINLIIDKDKNRVTLFDNGSGMSLDILKKYFLNVGVSYYKSKEFRYKGYEYTPIGNYGIGFLACFMLSNNVKIVTKQKYDSEAISISINKNSNLVGISKEKIQFTHGTEIILDYEEFMKVFESTDKVKTFIEKNFLADEIQVLFNYMENGESKDIILKLTSLTEGNKEEIDLSKYLNNIEVFSNVKFSKSCFLNSADELTGNDTYIYDISKFKLRLVNDFADFNVKDFVDKNSISYLEVAIIDDYEADEYNDAIKFLEDSETALSKISPNYISILHAKSDGVDYGIVEQNGIKLIEDIGFENLVSEFGQSTKTNAFATSEETRVVTDEGNKMLEFILNKKILDRNYSWATADQIYCKNVLVSNTHITIPYALSSLRISKLIINSRNKDLIPNVTRNDFPDSLKEELSYAIGKALHLWILETQELSVDERKLVLKFMDIYYSKNSCYIKEN